MKSEVQDFAPLKNTTWKDQGWNFATRDLKMKKEFKKLYGIYSTVEFYEQEYTLEINKNFRPFWRKNFNAHNDTYLDKSAFVSDEYLNIISSSKNRLQQRIKTYEKAMKIQQEVIDVLKKAAN